MHKINVNEEEEIKEEEVVDTELERLLAGGLRFCNLPKECGHKCMGVRDEQKCLPCLEPQCQTASASANLACGDDLCNICYTCELSEEPSIQLRCGHIFHANCVNELLRHKWSSLRISFAFMSCPSCKQPIDAEHVFEI